MTAATVEIVLVLLLIVANGVFSGSEIAVISARKARLEQLARRGSSKARLALKLANSPNNFLSTIQVGITLIGILSGALGGATIANRLKPTIDTIPLLRPYSDAVSLGIVVTTITYLSLVIGELVPKRWALSNPEQIACEIAKPMNLLSVMAAPVVRLLSLSTDAVVKLLGIREPEEPPVTEEEIRVLIEQGTQAGTFEESEQEMVERVFRLGDRPIKALMTPRTDITWLDTEDDPEENKQKVTEAPHNRFPVGRDSLDNCLGIVQAKSLFSAYIEGRVVNLEELLQPPLFVPENMRALKVLEQFKQSGNHIALVTDEYGGIEGLVTLGDLVEAIVGELPSEDMDEPMVVEREDGSWLLDGGLSTDQLKDLLDKEQLQDEEIGDYHTLGGFMMHVLGRIPKSSDHFEWSGFRFEVMDMDGMRVDKVLVNSLPSEMKELDDDDRDEPT